MFKSLKNPFKNSKLQVFFFFLLLSLFFWALTKFSREYTATVVSKVTYTNIPKTSLLAEGNPEEISFDLTENGFEFLFYKIKSPITSINVSAYLNESSNEVVITEGELKRIITKQISSKISIKNLSPSSISLKLDSLVSKKIPVIPFTEFIFKDGFRPISTVSVTPDSIVVSGPSEFIKEIDSIRTAFFSETNIETNIDAKIDLEEFTQKDVSIEPTEVVVSLLVDEFSQKQMVLPIKVLNTPIGTTIKLIPNVVEISFSASLSNFKNIIESDFELVCDYAERNQEENFMIPKLIRKPDSILNIEFGTKKIDYLVFK